MKNPPNTITRNGTDYLHVRVPNGLLESYGKRFITKSLGTNKKSEACSKSQAEMTALRAEFKAKLDAIDASKFQETAPTPMPALSFAEIARQHAREVSDREFSERAALFEAISAEGGEARLWKGDLIALPESRYFDHLVEEGDLDAVIGFIFRARAKDRIAEITRKTRSTNFAEFATIADAQAPALDPDRRLHLLRLIARAEIDALRTILADEPDAGMEATETPPRSPAEPQERPAATAAPSNGKSGSGPRLSLVLADWIAEKARTNAWREKTRLEREAAVKAFIEVIGDHPVGTYAKADAKRFKDVLFNIPPNAHKKAAYKGLALIAIAEKAESANDQKPTAKNVALRMDAVSSLFIWARKNFDEVTANPFEGVKPQVDTIAREERDPFSIEELKAIFAAPPFAGAKSEHHWLQPGGEVLDSSGKFWVPLIAAYTGARLMEIVQLQKADVQTIGDVTFFNITTDGGDKWLKTRGSKRRIPVHPALVTAGFLDFVAKVKSPSDRLFPDIEIGGAMNRSSPASKLFVRLIRAAGVKSRKNCFHSFRHSFEDACRDAEIDSAVMNALQGHVERGMAGRYGSDFKLERLDAAVKKIRYGLPFERPTHI
ncbi:putative integrase/resolvase recombinase protein [Mesorhizobium plurifarium]|uniref:Putative integrase/resolvase recombinase protein n=1 Tax=Mesorhizobium plurifarium TaxID=69974 RepID=A0A0K2W3D2_MESPL|nr:putative integrase/resolvase recombinase protein [Mesorhizobium plurifarium]